MLVVRGLSDKKRVNPQPLTDIQVAMIQALPKRAGCPFLFPARNNDGHMRKIDNTWHGVLRRAGMEDLRLHDLMRSVPTWAAQAGASEYQIQHLLGHETTNAARHYVHVVREEMNRGPGPAVSRVG